MSAQPSRQFIWVDDATLIHPRSTRCSAIRAAGRRRPLWASLPAVRSIPLAFVRPCNGAEPCLGFPF